MKRTVLFLCFVMTLLVCQTMSAQAQDRYYKFTFDMVANYDDPQNIVDAEETLAPLKVILIDDKDKYRNNMDYSPCDHENLKIESEDSAFDFFLTSAYPCKALGDFCIFDPKENAILFTCCDSSVSYMLFERDGIVTFSIITKDDKVTMYLTGYANEDNSRVFKKMVEAAKAGNFNGFEVVEGEVESAS